MTTKKLKKAAYTLSGTEAPWYEGRDITEEKREYFRETSRKSLKAKNEAIENTELGSAHPINVPNLDPNDLMPLQKKNGLNCLSLFSGGGGLDLGFDRAGFNHIASFELLDFAGETIQRNRPKWVVYKGEKGDVTQINWSDYKNSVDVLHGGPPCQPFSSSGRQLGKDDARDMIPEMVRAVNAIEPKAFVMENVAGLLSAKFQTYLQNTFYKPLSKKYEIKMFALNASSFGVPQVRRRCIFVGFKNKTTASRFKEPQPTHDSSMFKSIKENNPAQCIINFEMTPLKKCMGAREALGLHDIGYDNIVPTIRSTLTGPRHTTSILSSTNAQKLWQDLEIWPNGVQECREIASKYPAKNGHFRLSIADCALLQGFPEDWFFEPPVYKAAGQIGNSVVPPMAYWIARAVANALTESH